MKQWLILVKEYFIRLAGELVPTDAKALLEYNPNGDDLPPYTVPTFQFSSQISQIQHNMM